MTLKPRRVFMKSEVTSVIYKYCYFAFGFADRKVFARFLRIFDRPVTSANVIKAAKQLANQAWTLTFEEWIDVIYNELTYTEVRIEP